MFQSKINKTLAVVVCIFLCVNLFAQDNNLLLQQAKNLELKFDEAGALEKYKAILANDPSNTTALLKCTEFYCSIGERQKDKKVKTIYFDSADAVAQKFITLNTDQSNANYAMSLVELKKTETEDDNKKLIDEIKQMKTFADASLAADANNAKANFLCGMWHYNMIKLSWIKKGPIKSFCNCIPDTQLDSAASYMEKCRAIDPYYALNYLQLAKVYQDDNQPAKALDILNKLVRLPNRTFDDAAIKNEGRRMLSGMQ